MQADHGLQVAGLVANEQRFTSTDLATSFGGSEPHETCETLQSTQHVKKPDKVERWSTGNGSEDEQVVMACNKLSR